MRVINKKTFLKISIIVVIVVILFIVGMIVNLKGLEKNNLITNNQNQVSFITPTINDKNENTVQNQVIEEISTTTDSIELQKLANNSWDRLKAQLKAEYERDENGKYVYSDGYTINCESTNIQNIIFNMNYEGSVINNISVGATQKEIKEILGNPAYEDKNLKMIGYKTSKIYIFFYSDEISIYPNKELNNTDLENLIVQYMNKAYGDTRTRFVIDLKTKCPDIVATETDNGINLYSINRQIEVNLDNNNNIEICLYNGYKMSSIIEEIYEENENIKNDIRDFVELKEIERKAAE